MECYPYAKKLSRFLMLKYIKVKKLYFQALVKQKWCIKIYKKNGVQKYIAKYRIFL